MGTRGAGWCLVMAGLVAGPPVQAQRARPPAGGAEAVLSMREFHYLAPRLLDALALRPGDVVVVYGLTTSEYLAGLVQRVGPEGKVYAVYRLEPDYRELRSGADPPLSSVIPVFAADGDAHLEPGIADLVVAVDIYGFFQRELELYGQAHQVLRPGGRLVQVRSNSRITGDQQRRHPGQEGDLAGYAKKQELNRRLLRVTQFGFRFVGEVPVFETRTVRVFESTSP